MSLVRAASSGSAVCFVWTVSSAMSPDACRTQIWPPTGTEARDRRRRPVGSFHLVPWSSVNHQLTEAAQGGAREVQDAAGVFRAPVSSSPASIGWVTSWASRPPRPRWLKTRLSSTAATQPVEMPESRTIRAVSGKAW